jgi:polyisoprenoid-binding protein YceI
MTTSAVEIPGYVAGTWTIDAAHSDVGFAIRHMMVAKVRGRFTRFSGAIVTAADPLGSGVTAEIELASVDTGNADRDAHVRNADFLDVQRYPAMTYASTGLRRDGDGFVLDGNLTLREVTRPVPLRVEFNGFVPDFYRPDAKWALRMGLSATGEIARSEFGVTYNAPIPGTGEMGLGEKVQISLDIEAALDE